MKRKLKRIELAWKSLFIGLVTRLMSHSPLASGSRISSDRPLRILVLRQDRLGDAIITTGLLRALKAVNGGNVIDVLASPTNASLLRHDPNVGTVHIYNKRKRSTFPALRRSLRARDYDVAIDCMITAPSMTGLLLMLASGARDRIGIAGRGVDAALTFPVPRPDGLHHIIDLMAPLVSPIIGDTTDVDMSPRLEVQHQDRTDADAAWGRIADPSRTRLLVNISAGKPEREWPAERFVSLIEEVSRHFPELSVVVVGSPIDLNRARGVAETSGAAFMETPRIQDLCALIATADCLLTPDTSVTHIASAFRVPAVVLFQRQEIADQWGLYRSPGTQIVAGADSLAELPLMPVVSAVTALVSERIARAQRQT